ncbi:MAG: hypothetical protein IJV00_10155 [Clostridia bacterium]|nr:hypothetical protein [Clostridia bacterium]
MFDRVNLEISLKPFGKIKKSGYPEVCEKLFRQWGALTRGTETVSVMTWFSDGSELLDYAGDMGETFEWCRYIGTANNPEADETDPPYLTPHFKKRPYTSDPAVFTYGDLKDIVSLIKRTGEKFCPGAKIKVGTTFDIGPEFALSGFKYSRHREILGNSGCDGCKFVDSTSLLNADGRRYAAYPDGIPQNTPFAEFLGKQAKIFCRDMGFDFLWLSNGLGFSADPWKKTGKVFDGERFHPEKLGDTSKKVFDFWRLFRKACPDLPLETRGTNNTVGIDYASDGVPLWDIYRGGFGITPPPNSPWAALNGDFGIELAGHMTRICELPGEEFIFRYYLHDPWWANSPWFDRYNSCPHDVYLPMAVSRIDEKGRTRGAKDLYVLSVDNSYGDMPDQYAYEVQPHILRAEKETPDRPAPFVWVYPMKEFTTAESEDLLKEMYFGDKFILDAINSGFPLNCVVSSGNFMKTPKSVYDGCVLISPVQPDEKVREKLGSFALEGRLISYSEDPGKNASLIPGSGKGADVIRCGDGAQKLLDAAKKTGYSFSFRKLDPESRSPVTTVHRYDNGFIFSVMNPNTTTETKISFPFGAPVLDCWEAKIEDSAAVYTFPRCVHKECRVFVKQKSGVVSVTESASVNTYFRRVIMIRGLENADVCLFPETQNADKCRIANGIRKTPDGLPEFIDGFRYEENEYGVCFRGENISGDIRLLMPF